VCAVLRVYVHALWAIEKLAHVRISSILVGVASFENFIWIFRAGGGSSSSSCHRIKTCKSHPNGKAWSSICVSYFTLNDSPLSYLRSLTFTHPWHLLVLSDGGEAIRQHPVCSLRVCVFCWVCTASGQWGPDFWVCVMLSSHLSLLSCNDRSNKRVCSWPCCVTWMQRAICVK